MIDKTVHSIFKKGSRTYFYSSLFFPKTIKHDVFTLYSFVRKVDNYVDTLPQDKEGFFSFKDTYYAAKQGMNSGNIIIDLFVNLRENKGLRTEWVDAFFDSMERDLTIKRYVTLDDTIDYMYGSAEVIGLMMAKILGLPQSSYRYARLLARAMQYINFIRDINEDLQFNRIYFPQSSLNTYNLKKLQFDYTKRHPERFNQFIQDQIDLYDVWQKEAEKGYSFIPKRYLIPIRTASEMYKWTSYQIKKNPFIIYSKKVKPRRSHIIMETFINTLRVGATIPFPAKCPKNV